MIFFIATAATLLCVGACAFAVLDAHDDLGFAAVLGTLVCIIFWIVALAVVPLAARYSSAKCEQYGIAVDREVTFARYTHWSWDCLVRTDEGMIPKGQWYVDEGGR